MLKADGLALGKGVLICNTLEEAKEGVRTIMEDKKFGIAGNTMVVEEFMTGREVSVLSFVDGKTIKIMSSAQDHKRAGDAERQPAKHKHTDEAYVNVDDSEYVATNQLYCMSQACKY